MSRRINHSDIQQFFGWFQPQKTFSFVLTYERSSGQCHLLAVTAARKKHYSNRTRVGRVPESF